MRLSALKRTPIALGIALATLATAACGGRDPRVPAPFTAPACPAPTCGAPDTVRECQAKQVAAFVEARHQGPLPALLPQELARGELAAVQCAHRRRARVRPRWLLRSRHRMMPDRSARAAAA